MTKRLNIHAQKQDGFTLIEVMSALTIMVLVLVAFLPVFTQSANWTKDAGARYTTGNLLGLVAHDIRTNPALFIQDDLLPGEVQELSNQSLEQWDGLPEYGEPVTLSISFDALAGMNRVKIQIGKSTGYVYTPGSTPIQGESP